MQKSQGAGATAGAMLRLHSSKQTGRYVCEYGLSPSASFITAGSESSQQLAIMESAQDRKARLRALREAAQLAGGDEDAQAAAPEAEPTQEPTLRFRNYAVKDEKHIHAEKASLLGWGSLILRVQSLGKGINGGTGLHPVSGSCQGQDRQLRASCAPCRWLLPSPPSSSQCKWTQMPCWEGILRWVACL